MPFIRVSTNVKTENKEIAIKKGLGEAISLVSGKSECYLMVEIRGGSFMAYQGDEKTPLAMVEVQLLGASDPKELDSLTAAITDLLNRELGIPKERVYVNHLFFEYWGVDGHNV